METARLQPNRSMQRKRENSAVYERIALDVAKRIVRGEIAEGVRLSGRTLLSGEYGVSPETIRRSFALLEEMEVVQVMQNSGALVKSSQKAKTFIEKYEKQDESKLLMHRMRQILEEHAALDHELLSIAKQLFSVNTRFHEANPFPIFEYTISEQSKAVGKTLGELNFWQETEATVVAIRRDGAITLSPGPYLPLCANDVLMMVGPQHATLNIQSLLD